MRIHTQWNRYYLQKIDTNNATRAIKIDNNERK